MSLVSHPLSYELSIWEGLLALTTTTGVPYALRHLELIHNKYSIIERLEHGALLVLECVPVIGFIVAVTERVTRFVFKIISTIFCAIFMTPKDNLERMRINGEKALREHRLKFPNKAYASEQEVPIPSRAELLKKEANSLQFSYCFGDGQGPRPTMEDAHIYKEIPQGLIAGIFDGHGGKLVSNYASTEFAKRFEKALKDSSGDVYAAFTNLIDQIHGEIAKNVAWNHQGSTGVICFIDKETHTIYTATLGDSEANIYRNVNNQLKSIPLSCVRDWTSIKDLRRLMKAHDRPDIYWWGFYPDQAKYRRSQIELGVNVARGFGDLADAGTADKPIVIPKPKITVNKLNPDKPGEEGDLIVLACDGLKDYVPENEIVEVINNTKNSYFSYFSNVAKNLKSYALNQKNAQDNVSVLAIRVYV